jgi:predicted DNA-binding transcriptional regulator YafY
MLYQRSLDIERRLQAVLRLIRSGGYSTPMIAEQLGVSTPTVSRDVTALRERGHDIRSQRKGDGWRYVLAGQSSKTVPALRSTMQEARQ